MSELPSGTVTFLFTDLEGSTRLWEEHPVAMRDALARHDVIVRDAVESHGGRVVKGGGDGGLCVFGAVGDALHAAVAAQVVLSEEPWGATGPLRVRIGIHTGEAQCRDGDYFGPVLNRAARLMAVAHGGQIVCSQATADLARDVLADDVKLIDLGEHRLRDLSRPERVFQVDAPGLGSDFSALASLDAFPGNLPLQVSSFIGRDTELEQTASALDDARIVTLTGVGGVGKTRLAYQVAAEVLPRFREGAWLVELAAVRDPGGVADAFAAVFGVTARSGRSLSESLVEFLGTKQLLLVVDNCEHLLDPVAELIDEIVRVCPGVCILATSREGLALVGERILAVPSLRTPADHADLDTTASSDAVQLFTDRARAADSSFALVNDNAPAVVRLCRRLDGVPLALELAAARINVMSPAELATALDHRFEVLAGGRRGAVKRQQTLRATIDWSYDLLTEAQQRLLARLAVFAGGCTRSAAEAICAGDPIEVRSVFGLLTELVERSLVVAERDRPETRYRLLETIREYGEDRLAEHHETESLRERHAEYYTDFLLSACERMLGPNQIEVGRQLADEHENVLAALNYAIDTDNADLALRQVRGWRETWLAVGYRLRSDTEPVLQLTGAPEHPLYAFGLASAANQAAMSGDLETAIIRSDEAEAAASSLEDEADRHFVESYVWATRGAVAFARGATHDAAICQERAAEHARVTSEAYVAMGLGSAATFHVMAGDTQDARRFATEGLALARQIQMPTLIVTNLVALAGALADENPDQARVLLQESIQLRRGLGYENWAEFTQAALINARIGDWSQTLTLAAPAVRHLHWTGDRPLLGAVFNLVARAIATTDPEGAAVLQGAAYALIISAAPRNSNRNEPTMRYAEPAPEDERATGRDFVTELRRETTGIIRHPLGDTRLHELRTEGQHLGRDEAVAYALDAVSRATQQQS
jgi:predicted ATPase/class 3 adenylate cyclase